MNSTDIENELIGDASVYDDYGKKVEAAFQRMKQLAVSAGWPSSLVSEIVAVDKEWQKTKEDANAAKRSTSSTAPPVLAKIEVLIQRLEAHSRTPSQVVPNVLEATSHKGAETQKTLVSTSPVTSSSSDFLDTLKQQLRQQYGPFPLWGWFGASAGVVLIFYVLRKK